MGRKEFITLVGLIIIVLTLVLAIYVRMDQRREMKNC